MTNYDRQWLWHMLVVLIMVHFPINAFTGGLIVINGLLALYSYIRANEH